MSHLTNIVKKELKELLTPGSVISVLAMVFLFAMLGGLVLVPIVSRLTKKPADEKMTQVFSCYESTVTVHVTQALEED